MNTPVARSAPPLSPVSAPLAQAVVARTLRKVYERRVVLRDVSFELEAGRTLAVLGPNGAGKTTLLRVLATLTKPSAGDVHVLGRDVRQDANEVRRVVGYAAHQPLLYEELTAAENLLFFARMYGLPDAEDRAARLLARVGLEKKARDRVQTFSRGQAQRLALARAIVHDPVALLLDEPETGLDDDALALLESLVRERAAAGRTTILTTHQLERGLALADDALVLVDGRLVFAGAARTLSAEGVRELYRARRGQRPTKEADAW